MSNNAMIPQSTHIQHSSFSARVILYEASSLNAAKAQIDQFQLGASKRELQACYGNAWGTNPNTRDVDLGLVSFAGTLDNDC